MSSASEPLDSSAQAGEEQESDVAESFEELESQITRRFPTLSKRLQQTARYFIDHPQEVAFSTIAALAEGANVTPSTLIRFANSFGFGGFSEMQKLFRARLMEEQPGYSDRIRTMRRISGDSPGAGQLLWQFADASRTALEQLPHRIDPLSLERALTMMDDADAIHILGAKRSFAVASYLAYALRHLGKRAFLIDDVGGMQDEELSILGDRDLLVVVSFTPYAQRTQEGVAKLSERDVPIVAITDSTLSPVARYATVNFAIQEAEVQSFRGLSVSMCLAQTLAIGLGIQRDSRQPDE
ncbi:MurR/RpiR family transcriptional regulator [Carnimonas nigrificans]|uniref:MurR/RpiR family transcriptional regulator n=1 Tax=Carnimonas nigrificans TaxID=64323 RepID=UPI00046EE549|nr:MurR/RpiR family transcriptional regulator [Carnimonas nigrificans]